MISRSMRFVAAEWLTPGLVEVGESASRTCGVQAAVAMEKATAVRIAAPKDDICGLLPLRRTAG